MLRTFLGAAVVLVTATGPAWSGDFDLRWRGVALADLPGDEAALLDAAVRHANPAGLKSIVSVAWLERSLVHVAASDVSAASLVDTPRHLVQVIGRHARFATDGEPGTAKKPALGVVVIEARLSSDTSDLPVFRVVREAPVATLELEIGASLSDRTSVVVDEHFGFARVFPVGVGAIDKVRRPGYVASLTPATELGRVSRTSSYLSLAAPAWNRGLPYLPFEIPWVSQKSYPIRPPGQSIGPDVGPPQLGQKKWYVETRVAFHAFQGRTFSRGFNSHGCITLRDADLTELAALVFARPVPVPLRVQSDELAPHRHPLPHEDTHFWELENLGTAERPHITRGLLYAIKKVRATPPEVAGMVDIYMSGERRPDPLGPVLAQRRSPVPASLVP